MVLGFRRVLFLMLLRFVFHVFLLSLFLNVFW